MHKRLLFLMVFLGFGYANADTRDTSTVPRSHTSQSKSLLFEKAQSTPAECPTELFRQIKNGDKNKGWFGTLTGLTASESCRNHVRSHLDSPAELEQVLNNHADLNLGPHRPAGYLDKCMAQFAKRDANCRGQGCNTFLTVEEQSAAIADYYTGMNRLKIGASANLQTIAGIDRILGTPFLEGADPIRNEEIPGAAHTLAKLKADPACRVSQPGQTQVMAAQTRQALVALRDIEQKKRQNITQVDPNCTKSESARRNNCAKKIKDASLQKRLVGAEQALYKTFPWLSGAYFQQAVKGRYQKTQTRRAPQIDRWDEKTLEEQIQKHFQQTREALIKQNQSFKEASLCIHGKSDKHCMDKHFEALAEAPELDTEYLFKTLPGNATAADSAQEKKIISALAEIAQGECRTDMRVTKKEMGSLMNDLVLNVALTAATFGTSAYATAALKGAQAGANAAKSSLKAVDAFRKGSKVPPGAKAAVAVAVGADAAWLGPSGLDALNACTSDLSAEVAEDTRQTSFDSGVDCSKSDAKQVKAIGESRNCVLAASLAAIDALPLVPPLAARFGKKVNAESLADSTRASVSSQNTHQAESKTQLTPDDDAYASPIPVEAKLQQNGEPATSSVEPPRTPAAVSQNALASSTSPITPNIREALVDNISESFPLSKKQSVESAVKSLEGAGKNADEIKEIFSSFEGQFRRTPEENWDEAARLISMRREQFKKAGHGHGSKVDSQIKRELDTILNDEVCKI